MSLVSKINAHDFIVNHRRMWPFVKPFWKMALLSIILAIPVGMLDASVALFLKPYTDEIFLAKGTSPAWYLPLLIVGFTFIQGILLFTTNVLNASVGGKLTMGVKKKLYIKLLSLPPSYFDQESSGNILFRYGTDADLACAGLLHNLKNLVTRFCS